MQNVIFDAVNATWRQIAQKKSHKYYLTCIASCDSLDFIGSAYTPAEATENGAWHGPISSLVPWLPGPCARGEESRGRSLGTRLPHIHGPVTQLPSFLVMAQPAWLAGLHP